METLQEWKYKFKEERHGDYYETYQTIYQGQSISLSIRLNGHPVFKSYDDLLTLLIFVDEEKKHAIGICSFEGENSFVSFSNGTKIPCEPPQETPNLEAFIQKYKPIFESQRDLRERFKQYLQT